MLSGNYGADKVYSATGRFALNTGAATKAVQPALRPVLPSYSLAQFQQVEISYRVLRFV